MAVIVYESNILVATITTPAMELELLVVQVALIARHVQMPDKPHPNSKFFTTLPQHGHLTL
jgi:hypothetical protein